MEFKYPSTRALFGAKRSVVMSRNGMVASSQPLASLAGVRILVQGGNAVDAAITYAGGGPVTEFISREWRTILKLAPRLRLLPFKLKRGGEIAPLSIVP